MKVFKLVAWFVLFMGLTSWSLSMTSAPNNIENIIGIFVLTGAVYLSIKMFIKMF